MESKLCGATTFFRTSSGSSCTENPQGFAGVDWSDEALFIDVDYVDSDVGAPQDDYCCRGS